MTLSGDTNTTLTLSNVTTNSDVDGRRAKLDGTEPQVLIRGQSQPAIVTLDLSVPPPLNLQVATTSDAGLTLSWNALMGRAYRVQFNTDLTLTNWSNLVLAAPRRIPR